MIDKDIFVKVTEHACWLSCVVDTEISVKKCIYIDTKLLTAKCLQTW